MENSLTIKPEYSTDKYSYVTTKSGMRCTERTGIGKGILVNVSAVNDDAAEIWTVNAWGTMYTDTISIDGLQLREPTDA